MTRYFAALAVLLAVGAFGQTEHMVPAGSESFPTIGRVTCLGSDGTCSVEWECGRNFDSDNLEPLPMPYEFGPGSFLSLATRPPTNLDCSLITTGFVDVRFFVAAVNLSNQLVGAASWTVESDETPACPNDAGLNLGITCHDNHFREPGDEVRLSVSVGRGGARPGAGGWRWEWVAEVGTFSDPYAQNPTWIAPDLENLPDRVEVQVRVWGNGCVDTANQILLGP